MDRGVARRLADQDARAVRVRRDKEVRVVGRSKWCIRPPQKNKTTIKKATLEPFTQIHYFSNYSTFVCITIYMCEDQKNGDSNPEGVAEHGEPPAYSQASLGARLDVRLASASMMLLRIDTSRVSWLPPPVRLLWLVPSA